MCTHGDSCAGGTCSGTAYICDDKLACTTDTCTGSGPPPGGCSYSVYQGWCVIGGACHAAGAFNSVDPCQYCDPAYSTSKWRQVPCVAALAGDGTAGFADGPAASARFNYLSGVAMDSSGNVYVADYGNHRIRKISGGQVTTPAGTGSAGYVDGKVATAKLSSPSRIAVDGSGKVFFTDLGSHTIRLVENGQVSTLAGAGSHGFADGPVKSAKFYLPYDIVIGNAGKIYVADANNHRIRLVTGGQVTTQAGAGVAGYADGPASIALFKNPSGVALDSAGNVIVADTGNGRVRKVSGSMVSALAGKGPPANCSDGNALSAAFYLVHDVAVGSSGEIYVADYSCQSIRKVSGGKVTTVAGIFWQMGSTNWRLDGMQSTRSPCTGQGLFDFIILML